MADWISRAWYWFNSPPDDKRKKSDDMRHAGAPPNVSMYAIESGFNASTRMLTGLPPPSNRKFARACFSKQLNLPLLSCIKDGTRLAVVSMAETNGRDGCERTLDERDIKIQLCQIIAPENMIQVDVPNKTQRIRQFDSNYNVVIEVAIVVIDAAWDPQEQFIRVHLQNIAVYQQSLITLGDVNGIVTRSTEINPPKQPQHAKRATCPLNPKTGVEGWCYKCSTRPNTVTVYQAPLTDEEIIKYATELQSISGTHGHVKNELRAEKTDDNDHDDNDKHSNSGLEINPVSTLARDMCAAGLARFQPDNVTGGSVYTTKSAWANEVASVSKRTLFNLPLADVELATLRLCARIDARAARPAQTLQVSVVVQCLALCE